MDKNIIIGGIVATLLIVGGGVYFAGKATAEPKVEVSAGAKAEIGETTFDWGIIPIKGGEVRHSFSIRNSGDEVLKLYEGKTSCMCTTMQIKVGDESSPLLGMHGKSSWVGEVAPGGEAEVEAVFDPAYHGPAGLGSIDRVVSLKTNDPEHLDVEFNLTAEVVN